MPSGCDFTCKNEKCKHVNCYFTIISPWPLSKIENILKNDLVAKDKKLLERLKEEKENGRDYACIIFPNKSNLETEGYRIQLWCNDCKTVWDYDIEKEEKINNSGDAASSDKIPENCPKCNNKTYKLSDLIGEEKEIEITCPHCEEIMDQKVWFCKTTE